MPKPPATVIESVAPATVETPKSTTATVLSDALNMRNVPSINGALIATLKKGDRLTITGDSQDGWLPVEVNGNHGFINGSYVSIDEE